MMIGRRWAKGSARRGSRPRGPGCGPARVSTRSPVPRMNSGRSMRSGGETPQLRRACGRRPSHPAYRRIVAMGGPAIPLILDQLRRQPSHIFWALHEITGANPVKPESAGKVGEMVEDWLKWGATAGVRGVREDIERDFPRFTIVRCVKPEYPPRINGNRDVAQGLTPNLRCKGSIRIDMLQSHGELLIKRRCRSCDAYRVKT